MADLNSEFESLPNAELHAAFESEPDAGPKKGVGDRLLDKAKGAGSAIKSRLESMGQGAADTARGVEQGATLGAGPIINGAAEASTDSLRDLITGGDGADWLKNYRKHQQESAKNFKSADERSPYLYGLGEVGGTLGSAYLTGGLSAEANALRGAAGAGKMALAKQLGQAAIKGAGVGAVAGGLGSQGTLTDADGNFNPSGANETAADAIGGGVAGGVAAPAMELGGKFIGTPLLNKGKQLADYATNYTEKSPLLRQAKKAFEFGREGTSYNNLEDSTLRQGAAKEKAIGDVTNKLLDAQKTLGTGISDAVENSTSQLDFGPYAQATKSLISNDVDSGRIGDIANANKVMSVLGNLGSGNNGQFDPRGAKSFLPTLQSLIEETNDPKLKEHLITMKNFAEKDLSQSTPGLAEKKAEFNTFMKGAPETLVNGNTGTSWLSNARDPEGKLGGAVESVLSKSESPGSGRVDAKNRISNVITNLKAMEEENPGFLEKIGIDPDKLQSDIKSSSDEFAMSRYVQGEDPQSKSLWSYLGGANSGRGQVINKANIAGRAVKTISESPVADISRKLYNLPSESLTGVANKLKAVPGLSSLGQALENGLANKNESLKNAALFSIMQNPQARLLISGEEMKDQADVSTPIQP